MIVSMILWFPWLRAASFVFTMMLMFIASVAVAQDVPPVSSRIAACGKASKGWRLVGWGKHGLFFSVPKHGVKILGGKPDVDYVKFVIERTSHGAVLALWFGGMAFHPDPPGETLLSSASLTQTKLLDMEGTEIGLDSRGRKRDQSSWRWFGVLTEGAVYKDASAEDAALFDQIIDSACLIP